jgi:nitrile hydratase
MIRKPPESEQEHEPDEHDHAHEHGSSLGEMELRVRALETVLREKGYVDPAALDRIVEVYEKQVGPHRGARIVARAWLDAAFRQRLLTDATAAVNSTPGLTAVSDHLIALENTPQQHHLVVCTLCSCYPWEVLGLPPVWYKSHAYRSRAVRDPRGVLADFGVTLPAEIRIQVWDSTAETRYLVVPVRPQGTSGWTEEQLATLVTRDSMVGAGLALAPQSAQAPPKP